LFWLGTGARITAAAESIACSYDAGQTYRVSNDDLLETSVTVRTGPAHTRARTYDMPTWARAIRCVGPCNSGWCRIRWHGVVGWVPRARLTLEN